MLVKLYHQFKDGKTKLIAQRDVKNHDEMREWVKKLWETDPPPEGAVWLAVKVEIEV